MGAYRARAEEVIQSGLSEIDFHSIGRPGRHATPEEVLILGPNRKAKQECHGNNRPIVGISKRNTLASGWLELFVKAAVDLLDGVANFSKSKDAQFGV